MNQHALNTNDSLKITPFYLVRKGEMIIDSPVKATWPHVINYPSWQNFPTIKRISGEPGLEGEVVLLRKEEEGFSFPAYFARTIKLEPERRVIWKTYPEQQAPEVEFFGIVEFRLVPIETQTRFCFDFLYEFLVPHRGETELAMFQKRQQDNFTALFAATFPKLKSLVEKRG
jgi:hypothetical protein